MDDARQRGPLRVANVPSEECQPFDIDLLCVKLEAARLEREEREAASLLRKQVREAVRRSEGEHGRSKRSHRKTSAPASMISLDNNNNISQTSLSEHNRSPPIQRFSTYSQNLSWSNVNLSIPEHRAIDATAFGPPADDHEESSTVIASGSTSNIDADRTQQPPVKSPIRRNRFGLFKSKTSQDATPPTAQHIKEHRPDDNAKRRAISSPLLKTSFSNADLASTKSPIDSTRPSITRDGKHHSQHSMNYISEYAVCFDTSPTRDEYDSNKDPMDALIASPLPIDRPSWASRGDSNEGMRSLLNLPSMLRKDRKEKPRYDVEEAAILEHPPPPLPPPPAFVAATGHPRPHTRSHTAPEGLICEAVRRIEAQQQQLGRRKRRSMGALLQTILLPNHHGMNNATHCVAI